MLEQLQQALRAQKDFDALLITSAANRRYATGFPSSAGVCLITRTHGWFFTDFRYIEAARKKIRGFRVAQVQGGYARMVNTACEEDGVRRVAYEETAMICAEHTEWEQCLEAELVPMGSLISDLRMVKSRQEVDCCIEAQRIAERALEEVLNDIRPGVTERFLAARLTFLMLAYGGEKMSFDPIVVSGQKSSLPHGVPDDKPLEAGDFVVMDFGCTRGGYCSDMTRTVAVGHYTDEMAQVY
ncbi:MAG: M24 family metallopeptidase, partial [Butyricicoccaceae bacterium]